MTRLVVVLGIVWASVVGLPLGIAATAVLLARFRARVATSMRETATAGAGARSPEAVAEVPDGSRPPSARDLARPALAVDFIDPASALAGVPARSGPATARRRATRLAVVYGAAASALALVIAGSFSAAFSPQSGDLERAFQRHGLMILGVFLALGAPAVLAPTYVLTKRGLALAIAALALLCALCFYDYALFGEIGPFFEIWLLAGAGPTALALLLTTRRLRAVGPILIVGSGIWSGVSAVLLFGSSLYAIERSGARFAGPEPGAFTRTLSEYLNSVGVDGYVRALGQVAEAGSVVGSIVVLEHPELIGRWILVVHLLCLALATLVAWFAVRWLASLHRARRASDQMLTLDVLVLVFPSYLAVAWVSGEPDASGGWATLTTLSIAAFIAYKLVAWGGLRLLRRSSSHDRPRTLLLLRVFGFAGRSQRLLDDLGQRWRRLGPMRLIAGPDLAYATVEPYEFYDFLSRRLSRVFVKDREELESRLQTAIPAADPDGLYRVQSFYCHDDTWRMTVERLARDCDAVLMDLRGFAPANRGCVFEIENLLQFVPLARVVLLVDGTTDEDLLEHVLAEGWGKIDARSPNAAAEAPAVRVLRAANSHSRTLAALMALLCADGDGRRSPLSPATSARRSPPARSGRTRTTE